jgi:hypothetical protein
MPALAHKEEFQIFVKVCPRTVESTRYSPLVTISLHEERVVGIVTSDDFDDPEDARKCGEKLAERWLSRRA